VAVSNAARRDLLRSGIDPDRVATIYDGVDLTEFNPAGLDKAAFKLAAGAAERQTVLMVARICREKRQDLMLEAAVLLCRKIPDLMVLFAGESGPADQPYARSVMQLVRKLGLEKNVQFLGFRRRMQDIYAASDATVVCNDREALGTC